MYPFGGVAAYQNRNLWVQARAHQPRTSHPLFRYPNFRDHLPELHDSGHKEVIVLDDDDSDEEFVVTASQEPQRRKVVDINQVQRVARGPLSLLPGRDVELRDQSFIRIVEYLPDTEDGECIRGHRLLYQNHWELLMPERQHELVQLVKINDEMEVEDTTSTVHVSQVVRNCTVIFTNRAYNDLQYEKHVEKYTGDKTDQAVYFCRYTSADRNVSTEHGDPKGPPLAGRIERLWANQTDDGALATPQGLVEFRIPDSELRRQWRETERSKSRRYTFGDAFSGAGGTSLGAFQAGLKLKVAVDFDERAIETYKRNFNLSGTEVLEEDVADFINRAAISGDRYVVDFLHMSPPCQPFCGANRNPNLEKNERDMDSFSKVPGLLEVCKPRIVTLEEAKSLTDIDKRGHFRNLICWFIEKGYSIQWKAVELSRYGVPQTRNRTIIIASGPGERLPAFVQPTHGTEPGLEPFPSIIGAIGAIPPNARHQDEIPEMRTPRTPYSGEGLCATIMTSVKGHHFHPYGYRRFSIREYACLQTFPLFFVFSGTIHEMLRQIGNAVPPQFAETLFVHLKSALTAADEAEDRGQ
ncbi:uncharacterized protein PV07_07203 [Cladophialophora immunda]|uniref:DNA (cytosine-5-)-methyltransferase n=1 Tax=Cladophialophora immunda TaxID=569365 RepID=A0A0D2CUZ1_9EURO|nr:uncharacterized protein PV07_07203 [Cladophialophora immunda]KIW27469.1 hypothetical protein PV07_07203 [Cladophialophora immunda]OQV04123.1 hypothetical protein CLAIMM_09062 [Cladophialophora immunda]